MQRCEPRGSRALLTKSWEEISSHYYSIHEFKIRGLIVINSSLKNLVLN